MAVLAAKKSKKVGRSGEGRKNRGASASRRRSEGKRETGEPRKTGGLRGTEKPIRAARDPKERGGEMG